MMQGISLISKAEAYHNVLATYTILLIPYCNHQVYTVDVPATWWFKLHMAHFETLYWQIILIVM